MEAGDEKECVTGYLYHHRRSRIPRLPRQSRIPRLPLHCPTSYLCGCVVCLLIDNTRYSNRYVCEIDRVQNTIQSRVCRVLYLYGSIGVWKYGCMDLCMYVHSIFTVECMVEYYTFTHTVFYVLYLPTFEQNKYVWESVCMEVHMCYIHICYIIVCTHTYTTIH